MSLTIKLHSGVEKVYRDILPNENPDDKAFVKMLREISPYTMTLNFGVEAPYALFQQVKYLVHNRIPGDIVECGVWRGGSMMLISYALQYFGDTSRQLYLYDTFAGMTEPDDIDISMDGERMKSVWLDAKNKNLAIGHGGRVEYVKHNMLETGYPEEQMHFIVGDVLQTIPAQIPSSIACLRLDTDWYKSTRHELEHLYDLIVPHGVLIIDDYGWCKGARQATDEFIQNQSFRPMMHRVDETVRIIIKPGL
jgi:O-methyltransferase